MANILSQLNLETIAGTIGANIDVGITAINESATVSSRRVDNCYVKEETNNLISKAQKVFVQETAPTSESAVGLYYVGTAQPYTSYLVDSNGVVTDMGTADIDLSDYQENEDEDLTTDSKEVVGAINELKQSLTSASFPVGMIMPTLSNEVPDGWLLCDGSTYDWFSNNKTTKYYALYSVIKFTYGGNGLSFKVPDLRSRFLEGASSTEGHKLGKFVSAGLPDHDHVFTGTRAQTEDAGSHYHTGGVKRIFDAVDGEYGSTGNIASQLYILKRYTDQKLSYDLDYTNSTGSHLHTYTAEGTIDKASVHNSTYGANSTVQPNSLCVNYLIKY